MPKKVNINKTDGVIGSESHKKIGKENRWEMEMPLLLGHLLVSSVFCHY